MRWISGAVLAVMLGGCGGDSDDFAVYVKRSPDAALNSLSAIDVNGPLAIADKPISRTLSDGGIIQYAIPASDNYDDGIVRLTVSSDEKRGTKVAVMVDVPAVKGYVEGGQKVVAEDKVEKVLQDDLEAWAKNLESGGSGDYSTARIGATLDSVAFVLQNMSGGGLMKKASTASNSSFFDGGSDSGSDWAASDTAASNAGAPMSDPDDDASSYGQPMDDANSYEDDGGWGN